MTVEAAVRFERFLAAPVRRFELWRRRWAVRKALAQYGVAGISADPDMVERLIYGDNRAF